MIARRFVANLMHFFASPTVRTTLKQFERMKIYNDNKDYFIIQQSHRATGARRSNLWELTDANRSKYADDIDQD